MMSQGRRAKRTSGVWAQPVSIEVQVFLLLCFPPNTVDRVTVTCDLIKAVKRPVNACNTPSAHQKTVSFQMNAAGMPTANVKQNSFQSSVVLLARFLLVAFSDRWCNGGLCCLKWSSSVLSSPDVTLTLPLEFGNVVAFIGTGSNICGVSPRLFVFPQTQVCFLVTAQQGSITPL